MYLYSRFIFSLAHIRSFIYETEGHGTCFVRQEFGFGLPVIGVISMPDSFEIYCQTVVCNKIKQNDLILNFAQENKLIAF